MVAQNIQRLPYLSTLHQKRASITLAARMNHCTQSNGSRYVPYRCQYRYVPVVCAAVPVVLLLVTNELLIDSLSLSSFMRVAPLLMSGSTVIVGLNGALQKRFVLASTRGEDNSDNSNSNNNKLIPGNVHRAKSVSTGVGGKGQDVAVTLECLQFQGDLQLAQFVGQGAEGNLVYEMLTELLGTQAMTLTVRTAAAMRTCTSIVAQDSTTELVEPSGVIAQAEMEQFMNNLDGIEACSAMVFMGSMPPGCSEETYATIYNRVAVGKNTLCLIDSVAGLDPLLQAIATKTDHGPAILKLNASELCRLAAVTKTSSETAGVRIEELVEAIPKFLAQHDPHAAKALTAIAVTDGAHPAYLAVLPVAGEDEFRLFQLPVAKLTVDPQQNEADLPPFLLSSLHDLTLYPIGAGDAVAGGTMAAWKALLEGPDAVTPCVHADIVAALQGNDGPTVRVMLTAFSFGLACGSASCLQEQNSVLKIQDALALYHQTPRPTFLSSHKVRLVQSSKKVAS